ncbi:MAG: MMPL family transporter [Acidimicrobiales bacterium]|jgi:RND superfamily putative drug exporter
MEKFFNGLGRFTVRFRWLIVVVWAVGTLSAVHFLPSLASQVNNDNSAFLPANAPSMVAANLAEPLIGKSTLVPVIIIGVDRQAPITAADTPALTRLVIAAKKTPNVEAVQYVGASANGHAVQFLVEANIAGYSPGPSAQVVNGLTADFTKAGAPPGIHFHLAGVVATNVAQQQQSKTVGNRTQLLSILFIIVLLLFVFRSVLAPLVTLLPAAVVLQLSGALIGELGSQGLKISQITQLLLIVLILGAGTDYGLFLVFRVREGLRSGLEAGDAVAHAVSRVGVSISASAGTVILALLTLIFASFGIYHDLGVPLAIGIAVMLVAGVTLLPALLAILGRAVFWPAKIVPGEAREAWWGRVAQRVIRRPAHTLGVGILAFGALAFGAMFYTPAGFGGATAAPKGSDAAAGNAALAKYFPQSSENPTSLVLRLAVPVWKDPGAVVTAERELFATGLFKALPGPLDPAGAAISPAEYVSMHAMLGDPRFLPLLPTPGSPGARVPAILYDSYRATARFISPDGHTIQFEAGLTAGDPSSTPALNAVPAIRAALTSVQHNIGATASGVTGEAPGLADVSSISDRDLFHIVPIAIIAIALLLALVLRSLVAPLYLIASVMLSYFAALGLSSIIFIKLAGSGGLTFLLPFLMFIFLLALGEDYNILVMTRIREEAHKRPLRDAVVTAVGASGPTITSAGLVLAGTFLVLAATAAGEPGGSQIRDIGIGLALGILMDTFLVRSLLVPSTVSLLGRWNWWPGKLAEMDIADAPTGDDGHVA